MHCFIIRDKDNQQQDIANLSRDTDNAHQALDNNFDKDKIKDQLEIQKEAVALGTQAMDAYKQSKLNEAKADIRAQMAANGELNGLTEAQINQKIVDSEQYKNVDKEYGVGSNFWTNGSAATGLLAGVLGGNVTGGMAAGAAPYMAALVKESTDNPAARAALHAIVSGALASAQGANPGAAAAGGFIASASADALAMAFYGTTADKLVGDEKTMISNLVVLFGAAAGAAAGGDGQAIASGGNAARVEVENNSLSMDETKARDKELAACTTAECKQAVRAKYFDLYFSNEDKAEKCASAAQCMSVYHELEAEQKEYAQREQELRNNFSNLNDEEKKELFALQKVIQNYDGTKNAALHYATRYADDGSPISEVDKAILAAGVGAVGKNGGATTGKNGQGTSGSTVKADAATQADAAKYFGQQRQYWANDPVQFNGNKVYQRNDLFDPKYVDPKSGKTNLQLMEQGRAPIGYDGKSINLHHMTQKQSGPIAEVTQTFHKDNHSVIHVNDNSIPSGIDRSQFNKWRSDYWKARANDFK